MDRLGNSKYFADPARDTGDGYIGNNFGQDLRNFRKMLEFIQQHNGDTVYFRYG